MKVFIVGGTGFLGYYAIRELLKKEHSVTTVALPPMPEEKLFPGNVTIHLADINDLSDDDLLAMMAGHDAFVFAAGRDERTVPDAPAYPFFRKANVDDCLRLLGLARQSGITRAVILNSYFAYFDRVWPELELAKHHPYVRSRVEQAEEAIAAGGEEMAVMILELPYIFGTMPGREPLWTFLVEMWRERGMITWHKGGTACITAKQVGQAVVGALERGEDGGRYPIGWQNLTWHDLYSRMRDYASFDLPMLKVSKAVMKFFGWQMRRKEAREGKEAGSHLVKFMDVYTREAYLDPAPAMAALGYEGDDLDAALKETMQACVEALS